MSKDTEPIRSRRELRAQWAQTGSPAGDSQKPSPATPKQTDAGVAETVPVKNDVGALSTASSVSAGSAGPTGAAEPGMAPRSEPAVPRERESLTRARDRAALRAYKELLDAPAVEPLPSRRALRQAQLDADRAPITAVNSVVSAAAIKPAVEPGAPATGAQDVASAAQGTVPWTASVPRNRAGRRASANAVDEPTATTKQSAAVSGAAVPAAPVSSTRDAGKKPVAPSQGKPSPKVKPSAVKPSAVKPSGVQLPARPVVPPATPAGTPKPSGKTSSTENSSTGSSVGASAVDAGNDSQPPLPGLVPARNDAPDAVGTPTAPVSAGTAASLTPTTAELQALTAQRAETERAAVLAQRAQARERLAQESAKSLRPVSDPTATYNLAMVTPLEFIEVPGIDRPVPRPPVTTHVPIITRATPKQTPRARKPLAHPEAKAPTKAPTKAPIKTPETTPINASGSKAEAETGAVLNSSAERFDAAVEARNAPRPAPGNRLLAGGRSSTLKRAEAMAADVYPTEPSAVEHPAVEHPASEHPDSEQAAGARAEVHRSQMPPMPADYAHGLEPLDAMTAGLRRTQRNRLLQWGSLIVGGAALIVGAILFITTLTR